MSFEPLKHSAILTRTVCWYCHSDLKMEKTLLVEVATGKAFCARVCYDLNALRKENVMESNFVTVVEATKGEQLKVSRWQYKPETALLAAGWVLVSTYMTTSLSKAPRKLAALPWVQALQQHMGCPAVHPVEAGKGVSLPLPAATSTEALGAACVHCGKPRQGSHYQTGACFTGANSYSPMAQDGSNLEGAHEDQ